LLSIPSCGLGESVKTNSIKRWTKKVIKTKDAWLNNSVSLIELETGAYLL